jgi:hypothetical protein
MEKALQRATPDTSPQTGKQANVITIVLPSTQISLSGCPCCAEFLESHQLTKRACPPSHEL